MKTVLMGLILVMSASAQARVVVQTSQNERITGVIERINIDVRGAVTLFSGTQSIAIPRAVTASAGFTNMELIELIEKYNRSTDKTATLSLRMNPDNSVGQLNISISQ